MAASAPSSQSVLLIGNYAADRQQSMQRFGALMVNGLTNAGIAVEMMQPPTLLGGGGFAGKWLGYVDKFILFSHELRRRLRSAPAPALVHICDHSNAMYARQIRDRPVVVTCHDMLAVRGGMGESTDTPASRGGKWLQRWIVRGLERADAIACVSYATCDDVARIVTRGSTTPAVDVITLGLSYPYHRLEPAAVEARLKNIVGFSPGAPFVLHVGSNLRRKNREGVLRIFARAAAQVPGNLVFAGEALTPALRSLGAELGLSQRIIEVENPANSVMEALYNRATTLLFPSRFEGFGWPIAEAQACGCPVICSDRAPMPEVAGDAGLIHSLDDEEGFAADLIRLSDAAERARWSEKSLRNAERFSAERMINHYIALYRRLVPQL